MLSVHLSSGWATSQAESYQNCLIYLRGHKNQSHYRHIASLNPSNNDPPGSEKSSTCSYDCPMLSWKIYSKKVLPLLLKQIYKNLATVWSPICWCGWERMKGWENLCALTDCNVCLTSFAVCIVPISPYPVPESQFFHHVFCSCFILQFSFLLAKVLVSFCLLFSVFVWIHWALVNSSLKISLVSKRLHLGPLSKTWSASNRSWNKQVRLLHHSICKTP